MTYSNTALHIYYFKSIFSTVLCDKNFKKLPSKLFHSKLKNSLLRVCFPVEISAAAAEGPPTSSSGSSPLTPDTSPLIIVIETAPESGH